MADDVIAVHAVRGFLGGGACWMLRPDGGWATFAASVCLAVAFGVTPVRGER